MRHLLCLYLLLLVAVTVSGCSSRGSTPNVNTRAPAFLTATPLPAASPATTETPPPSATSSSTPTPTQNATSTPPATLELEQAEEVIRTLLREPVDCLAPCFWGITPGQTTLAAAINVFAHLGLQVQSTTQDNKEFYGIAYEFDNGLKISPVLTIQDEMVKNLTVYITPEEFQPELPREWLAYSPETLISQYGPPSKVVFFVDRGAPSVSYAMAMYFDEVKLIVLYDSDDVGVGTSTFQVCPLTNQFDSVRLWLGEDPEYPPGTGVPLEEAASMTMKDFAVLLTGNPENACVQLKEELFP